MLEIRDKTHVNTGDGEPTFKSGKARLPEFIQYAHLVAFIRGPSFQAYTMFAALNRKYARLKPIFEQPARGQLGKHKMVDFTMELSKVAIKRNIEQHYPIKATKVELFNPRPRTGSEFNT